MIGMFDFDQVNYSENFGLIELINCSISGGVSLSFPRNIVEKIIVKDCIFEKSCNIFTSIDSCKFDKDGILTISKSQRQNCFKFNDIEIYGADKSVSIIMNSKIQIKNTGLIRINSQSSTGLCSNTHSNIFIENSGVLSIHSIKSYGLLAVGSNLHIKNTKTLALSTIENGIVASCSTALFENNTDSNFLFHMLVFRKNMEVRVESDQIRVVLGKGKGVFNVYPYETVIDKKPFNYGTLSVLTTPDKTVTYLYGFDQES